MNQQPIEKRVDHAGDRLAVNSVFHTIQGEGPFAGSPAVFLRLAGCNLQCPMCDTEYTQRITMGLGAIMTEIAGATRAGVRRPKLIVITGGEPFRQPIGPLCRRLLDAGYQVQVETNGTMYGVAMNDVFEHPRFHVVVSPKTGSINPKLVPYIKALKYVGAYNELAEDDGLPLLALGHTAAPRLARPPKHFDGEVYLQPADHQDATVNALNLTAVVKSCLKHGHRLCIQTHKIIGVP